MVADGYATPEDIDTAMKLGCGYERGLMQMLDGYGSLRVAQVLGAMAASQGDLAFAPPKLLIDHARAGLRFLPTPGQ